MIEFSLCVFRELTDSPDIALPMDDCDRCDVLDRLEFCDLVSIADSQHLWHWLLTPSQQHVVPTDDPHLVHFLSVSSVGFPHSCMGSSGPACSPDSFIHLHWQL